MIETAAEGPVIACRDLYKTYGGRHAPPVLRGIDLAVPRGAVMGLIGANGEGKSTLIKCLLGLLKITSGRASVLGDDPWKLSAATKARIGYVPQEPALLPWMTLDQSMFYASAFYPSWDHAYADRLVKELAVPRNERLGTWSLGQKQKAAIVLGMGHRPELLVLDEPVAALDPLARRRFLQLLVNYAADERRTILFSTHITSDLERVASHLAVMKGGRIAFCGELDALKEQVKRLRISAAADLPASFSVEGAWHTSVEGRSALVAVPAVDQAMLDALRDRWHAEVSVEDLNLEEIFVEMNDV